jgi:hypothetical protein
MSTARPPGWRKAIACELAAIVHTGFIEKWAQSLRNKPCSLEKISMLRKLTLIAAVAAALIIPAEAMARGGHGGHGGHHGGGHHGGGRGGHHGHWRGHGRLGGCRHFWNGHWHPYCFR